MFKLKDIIFKFFGDIDKANDSFKDVSGIGVMESTNLIIGEDYDDEIQPLLQGNVDNLIDPNTAFDRFVPYLETIIGSTLDIYEDIDDRRKIVRLINSLYDRKGTKPALRNNLTWLGFDDVVIIEHFDSIGFDSDLRFDNDIRRLDSSSGCDCAEITIQLYGDVIGTDKIVQQIFTIVEFHRPIDVKIRDVTLNGNIIIEDVIDVYISDGTDGNLVGDLIYNNDNDPDLSLRIAEKSDEPTYLEGDLIIEGPNAEFYSINSEGDLLYVFGSGFRFNNALKLNGGSEHVSIDHIPEYNRFGGDMSFSFWIKLPDLSGIKEILSKRTSGAGFRIYFESNRIKIDTYNQSSDKNTVFSEESIDTVNTWYHVLIEISSEDANNYRIFINNVSQTLVVDTNDQDGSGDAVLDNSLPINISNYNGSSSEIVIDELIIIDNIMSSSVRGDLYNLGNGNSPFLAGVSGILLRHNFDEILGLQIFDQSDNSNHGTLVNAPGDNSNRIIH